MMRMLIVLLLAFSGATAGAERLPPELEGATLYRMTVQGMSCRFCAYSVEQRLNALDGVQYVDVDEKSGKVLVGVARDMRLSQDQMQRLYEEAGFKLLGMEEVPLDLEHLQRP